jgi:hypothetical protein
VSRKGYRVLSALRAIGSGTAVQIAEAADLEHYRQVVGPLLLAEAQGHVTRAGRVWALTKVGQRRLSLSPFDREAA